MRCEADFPGEPKTIGDLMTSPNPARDTVPIRLPTANDFRCCGCGTASFDGVKPCDCYTMVGSRRVDGKPEYRVFMSRAQARRLALSELIKTRLLGIRPEDQDLILEDHDWIEIISALEGASA